MSDGVRRRLRYSAVRGEPGTLLRELNVAGCPMLLGDLPGSVAVEVVAGEVGRGAYDFSDIMLTPGDTVVDLGAHVGVVSIFLAKTHPGIRVLAFEPVPPVFALLKANLGHNRVRNVSAFNLGVSAEGADIELVAHLESNTGGATSYLSRLDLPGHQRFIVPTLTLDEILQRHGIERLPLLKVDIEGGEYDVLAASKLLARVENIRGEFHENAFLASQGHSMAALRAYCDTVIGPGRTRFTECFMPDV